MPVTLSDYERDLLMALQYDFSRGAMPYHDAAEKLGVTVDEVVATLKRLRDAGLLKRVGFYVNYRSKGLEAALIAYNTNGKLEEVAKEYLADPDATHVYQRDHPVYDLWVVTKRRSLGELVSHAEEVANRHGVDYIVLYSVRTYKLSVKYDLYKGVSRAGPYSKVNPKPPDPSLYGVDARALHYYRSLELTPNPYSRVAQALGVSEEDASRLAWRLVEAGILGDPGAALDGDKAGFTVNAMVVMEPGEGGAEGLCERAASLPFTTHVVLRASIPEGRWRHTCYFMVHAVSEDLAEELIDEAAEKCKPRSLIQIKSIADLKPGTVR